MKFDKHHKVILSTLNKEEAEQFIIFLLLEKNRHIDAIFVAEQCIKIYEDRAEQPMRRLFRSEILRHKEDIEDIDKLIARVKEKFES